MMNSHIFLSTGEVSGDLYGSLLIPRLRGMIEGIHISAMGGERIKKEGVELVIDSSSLSVVGFVEVLKKWREIKRAWGRIKKFLDEKRPDLAILIDYPGFNLRLARELKKRNIPVLYYSPPQIWAWGKGRIKKIKRWVAKVAVIFPFEKELYAREGIEAKWVGHPLREFLNSKENSGKKDSIGLLPGSREEEVKRILPLMLRVGEIIARKRKENFLLSLAPSLKRSLLERYTSQTSLPLKIERGSEAILRRSKVALVASGTVSLEGAILGTPMVVIYTLNPLSYLIARTLVRVPWVSLVNILLREEVVPEFIQHRANPSSIASQVEELLEREGLRRKMEEKLKKIRELLGKDSPSERVASMAKKILEKERGNVSCGD